jgi:hypothetical protein
MTFIITDLGQFVIIVISCEIDKIYLNLKGDKTLRTYKLAGHENYLLKYKDAWIKDIWSFLKPD